MLLCPVLCPPPNPTECYRLPRSASNSKLALHLAAFSAVGPQHISSVEAASLAENLATMSWSVTM